MTIEAYRIQIGLIVNSNANTALTEITRQFEALQKIIGETQSAVKELGAGMKGIAGLGTAAAREWREVAAAMRSAATATDRLRAGGAGAAVAGARSRMSETMGTAAGTSLVPAPRRLPYDPTRYSSGTDMVPYRSGSTEFDAQGNPYTPYGTYDRGRGSMRRSDEARFGGYLTYDAMQPRPDGDGFTMREGGYSGPTRNLGALAVVPPGGGDEPPGGRGFTWDGPEYRGGRGLSVPPVDSRYGLFEDGVPSWLMPKPPAEPARIDPYDMRRRNLPWERSHHSLHQTAVESGLAAYGGIHWLKEIAEPTVEAGNEIAVLSGMAQMSPANVEDAKQLAYDMVWQVPGMKYTDALSLIQHNVALTGDYDEAKKLTPGMARDAQVLTALGHGSAISEVDALAKSGELTGLKGADGKIDYDKYTTFMDRMTETAFAMGPSFNMNKFLTGIRMFGLGADAADMDFITAKFPAYMKIMGETKAGTALSSFRQSMFSMGLGKGMGNKRYVEEQIHLGLRDEKGNIPAADREMMSKDTDLYVLARVLPALAAHNYKDRSEIEAELYKLLPRQTAARLMGAGIFDAPIIDKEAQRNLDQQKKGTGALDDLLKSSPGNNIKELQASLQAFYIMLGSSVMKPAAEALNDLTKALHMMADWAKDNPERTKQAIEGFAFALGAFAATSAAASALAILTNPVGGMIALAFGIEALGKAFKNIPKELLDFMAGASVGAVAGGTVGGVPGAVIGATVGGAAGVVIGSQVRSGGVVSSLTNGSDSPFGLSPDGRVTVGGPHVNPWTAPNNLGGGAKGTADDPQHVVVMNPGSVSQMSIDHATRMLSRPQSGPTSFDGSATPAYQNRIAGH